MKNKGFKKIFTSTHRQLSTVVKRLTCKPEFTGWISHFSRPSNDFKQRSHLTINSKTINQLSLLSTGNVCDETSGPEPVHPSSRRQEALLPGHWETQECLGPSSCPQLRTSRRLQCVETRIYSVGKTFGSFRLWP